MAVEGLHTIVLQVSDLEASIAFHESALGVRFSRPSARAAGAKLGHTSLLLHVEHEALPPQRGAGVHINFSVPDAAMHRAELEGKGLRPGALSARPWGLQFALSDPDGYVLEFLGPSRP
jgi:catechol 2,3-dioxygenase-like lactoylglutathione lyase family enzyme